MILMIGIMMRMIDSGENDYDDNDSYENDSDEHDYDENDYDENDSDETDSDSIGMGLISRLGLDYEESTWKITICVQNVFYVVTFKYHTFFINYFIHLKITSIWEHVYLHVLSIYSDHITSFYFIILKEVSNFYTILSPVRSEIPWDCLLRSRL